jgi:hypothetical protein
MGDVTSRPKTRAIVCNTEMLPVNSISLKLNNTFVLLKTYQVAR